MHGGCFTRGADARFDLIDALLTDPSARSFVERSQAASFQSKPFAAHGRGPPAPPRPVRCVARWGAVLPTLARRPVRPNLAEKHRGGCPEQPSTGLPASRSSVHRLQTPDQRRKPPQKALFCASNLRVAAMMSHIVCKGAPGTPLRLPCMYPFRGYPTAKAWGLGDRPSTQ